jgi:hypothetical protein
VNHPVSIIVDALKLKIRRAETSTESPRYSLHSTMDLDLFQSPKCNGEMKVITRGQALSWRCLEN